MEAENKQAKLAEWNFGPDWRFLTKCSFDWCCAALNAVHRIVQPPSHAVSAAQAGLAEPLAKLMREDSSTSNDTIPLLALEILHVLVSSNEARQHSQLLPCGVFQGVCTALGNAATSNQTKPTDSRADIAYWGIEILEFCLSDVEESGDFALVLESPVIECH